MRGVARIARAGRRRRRDPSPEWEYCPDGWVAGDAAQDWNHPSVAQTMTAGLAPHLAALRDDPRLAVDGSGRIDLGHHNTLVTFGYVAAEAASRSGQLSVLDWGGGVAPYYPLTRALLPEVSVEYHCVDVPVVAAAGRRLQGEVSFHDTDGAWMDRQFDLVVASSSLQYVRDWRDRLAALATVAARRLFITRLPIVDTPSFVVRQRPHRHGYLTEYQGWCLNRQDIVTAAEAHDFHLLREFHVAERLEVPGAPSPVRYAGLHFARRRPVSS